MPFALVINWGGWFFETIMELMKKLFYILLLCPFFLNGQNAQTGEHLLPIFKATSFGSYNVIIGKGMPLPDNGQSYVVIVGEYSGNIEDMTWHVDYSEPLLWRIDGLQQLLHFYENVIIVGGLDSKETRKRLVEYVINLHCSN